MNMRGISVNRFGSIKEMVEKSSLVIPTIGDWQVLIKVISAGINPVDTYIRGGVYPSLPTLPYTPGKDGAGIVSTVGKCVTQFKKGDRVFCSHSGLHGTLAEYSAVNENEVFKLDDRLSFDEGAAIGIPYFTAYRALFILAKAKKESSVLVHGASGAVGLAAVQIAKAHGMKVIGTAGTELGIQLVTKNGADAVYNHRDNDYLDKIRNEQGDFDVILEMMAHVNLPSDLTMMKTHGVTVVIGCRGDVKINPRLLMKPETSIIGISILDSTKEEMKRTSDDIISGVGLGWVKPVISKVYPLEAAAQAHHDVIEKRGTYGKLVVRVQEV